MYRDRCDEWIVRAFGIAWVVDRVVLAMPAKNYLEMYRERIRIVAKASQRAGVVRSPNVEAVHVEVGSLDDVDSEAVHKSNP